MVPKTIEQRNILLELGYHMSRFYNWQKTMSYDAPFNMIITARGRGKTYGLRKQFVKDYLKYGYKFAVIVRNKNKLEGSSGVQYGFFDKLQFNNEFPDYVFDIRGKFGYIAKKPENEEDKPKWELIGYFVSLREFQSLKERTFINVRRIVFDEFIIDKRKSCERYLPSEPATLANCISSLTREQPEEKMKARIYLLGNACDIGNPYFAHFGVKKAPKNGYTWVRKGFCLLHMETPDAKFSEAQADTLAGQLVTGTSEAAVIVGNEFMETHKEYIADKPSRAKFQFGVAYLGMKFGIWCDYSEGYFYVNNKIPNNTTHPIYSLSNSDNETNFIIAKRADKVLSGFVDMYYMNIVKYDTEATYNDFMTVLALFGVK